MRESRPGGRRGGSLEDHREHRDPMDLFQWFHGSSTLVTVMSSEPKVNRHESKRYKRPSATQRLIVADGLGKAYLGFVVF